MISNRILTRTAAALALCALLAGCSSGFTPRLMTGDRPAIHGQVPCQKGRWLLVNEKGTREQVKYEVTANALLWLADNPVYARTIKAWPDRDNRVNRIRHEGDDKFTPVALYDEECNALPAVAVASTPAAQSLGTLPPAPRSIPQGDVAAWLFQRLLECFLEGGGR